MRGAEAVLACLRAEGVKYIFGNPGSTEIPLLDALAAAEDIKYIVTLHESVAVGMADGYARAGGNLGFVNVHTAAGTANSLSGIFNAWVEHSPVVITAGCKDLRLLGRECFLEVPDLPGIPRQFTKLSWQVLRAENIAEDLLRGIKTALTPPRGPVFLALPENLLNQEVNIGEIRSQRPKTPLTFSGDGESIKETARILAGAKAPLMVVGSEVAQGNAVHEAVALADLLGLPVMTDGRDALSSLNFPQSHPSFRGCFEPGSPDVKKADVLLGIGCKMFVESDYNSEHDIPATTRIIHFHANPHEIARLYPEEVSVLTDVKKGLIALAEALNPWLTKDLAQTITERRGCLSLDKKAEDREKEAEVRSTWNDVPIQLPRLITEMQAVLAPDTIIVDEGIRSSRALLKFYAFDTPGTYYRSPAGALGWGVPAALGVKLANPERQVIAFMGDGSFLFTLQSLWTAAKYNIAIVIVICNNRQYKAVKDGIQRYNGHAVQTGNFIATDISAPDIDFCLVAAGLGVWAQKVSDPAEIKAALAQALALGKPAVLDVQTAQNFRFKTGS